jgi:hypothetical protein
MLQPLTWEQVRRRPHRGHLARGTQGTTLSVRIDPFRKQPRNVVRATEAEATRLADLGGDCDRTSPRKGQGCS